MSVGGGGGGGGDNSAAEEARKAELRDRIDRAFGVKTTRQSVLGDPEFDAGLQAAVGDKKLFAKNKAIAGYIGPQVTDPEAVLAKSNAEAENKTIADTTRSYYTDDLARDYEKAERQKRFQLARQRLSGGSEDVYQQGELKSDRDLGATRIDDTVRGAVAKLNTAREGERLNALQLVAGGAGESAVSAAHAGLKNAYDTVASGNKAELFGDLFSSAAQGVAANNVAAQNAALLARYQSQLGSFFPTATPKAKVTSLPR